MATTVCDFALPFNVGDAEVETSMELPAGQRKKYFEFKLPPGTRGQDRAIVSFMLHATDPDDLKFKLWVNDNHFAEWKVNSDVARTFQEIVGPNVLDLAHLDKNNVAFEPISGDGVLAISDVVLWFQRTI
jgi:hypothetical protein